MKPNNKKGLTLVELLVTISIMTLISTAIMPLLSVSLEAHSQGTARCELYHEGLMAMERMTGGVRNCTFLLIPNAHSTTRNILAFSGAINDDDDYYFDDPLFPRIDEDPYNDSNNDGESGIANIDDNGDGLIDDWVVYWDDDDEDKLYSEDWLDGIDNDLDGNIDEDGWRDNNEDGFPGIMGMDDDGDGFVDEGDALDDDEDGLVSEDNLNEKLYLFNNETQTLTETIPFTNESAVLSNRVSQFQTYYYKPELIAIQLELTGEDGESVQFLEYVYNRNALQKTGKKVR